MLHLYYFESLINSMAICLVYEFSPNMIGIQDSYNKNSHEDHWIYEKFDSLHLFGNIEMVILDLC
mgnify:CR=1 FL=1